MMDVGDGIFECNAETGKGVEDAYSTMIYSLIQNKKQYDRDERDSKEDGAIEEIVHNQQNRRREEGYCIV